MTYDSNKHKRRSIRLQRYNYAQAGVYFVTVVAQHRLCLFGEISESKMRLNEAGEMIASIWEGLSDRFSNVQLDTFIVMPNHIHGIIVIQSVGAGLVPALPPGNEAGAPTFTKSGVKPWGAPTLGDIVGGFKSLTTHTYIQGVRNNGWQPFDKRFWQRNYYDHVIRNEGSLNEIRHYIGTNPMRWQLDRENPHSERGRLQESPLRDNRDS